jgi:hypothetical protein
VFRLFRDGLMSEDVVAPATDSVEGEPLLAPAMRDGEIVMAESLERMRDRAARCLAALPPELRRGGGEPYPVRRSEAIA